MWHTPPCLTKNFWRWYNEFDCHFRRHCFRCHCYCCQDQWWKVKTIITADEAFCRLSIKIHLASHGTWVAMVISCVQLHLKHVFISNWVLCSILPIFAGCHMDSPSVMMRGMIFVMQEYLSFLRQFLYNCFVSIVKVEKTMYPFLDLSWTSPSYCIDGGWHIFAFLTMMWYVWPFLCSRLKPAHVSVPTWGLTGANGNGYAAEKWCPSF